jgi:hypothetical protein
VSTNDNKNNINNKKGMHINELYQQQGASRATTGTTKRASTGNVIMNNNNLNNNLKQNGENKNLYKDIVIRNEDDLQKLSLEHEKLINTILTEEEEFINEHRTHIDDVVELVKQEMLLINDVDKPGSDIDSYVTSLDKILKEKAERIEKTRSKLLKFQTLLKEEEFLSQKFYQYQNEFGGDDNYLNFDKNNNKEMLDDIDNFFQDK